jgi:multidrug transporter EmrE-like cation transporter
MGSYVLIAISVLMGVFGQILLKQGTTHLGGITTSQPIQFFIAAFSNVSVLAGFSLYFLSSLIWLMVLSKVDLSFAYPMLSFGYVLILAFSAIALHEHISYVRIFGVILIILGVLFITRS